MTNYYFPILFSLIILFLTIFTIQVILLMKKLPHIINNSEELREERRNLFIVLIVFNLAFVLRIILNFTLWPKAYGG